MNEPNVVRYLAEPVCCPACRDNDNRPNPFTPAELLEGENRRSCDLCRGERRVSRATDTQHWLAEASPSDREAVCLKVFRRILGACQDDVSLALLLRVCYLDSYTLHDLIDNLLHPPRRPPPPGGQSA